MIPRYQALARCLDHIRRVEGDPKFAIALNASLERLARLMDSAPRGSGFDNGTTVDQGRGGTLEFTTVFHHMDENGYYDGWTHHVVRVKPSLAWGFDLTASGPNRNEIKDYITDVFEARLRQEVDY